jgi:glutathione peroxidase-family protein
LYDTYKDRGLVVVGVHTPEFPFEKVTSNVQTAIKRHGIKYPVAQDNDFATWKAYHNQYWPAQYIIDRNGTIVFEHAGEGQYAQTEQTIQKLLNDKS